MAEGSHSIIPEVSDLTFFDWWRKKKGKEGRGEEVEKSFLKSSQASFSLWPNCNMLQGHRQNNYSKKYVQYIYIR